MAEETEQFEPNFVSPDEFESFDEVDSETIELSDDSYDEGSVVDEEVSD